MDPLQEITSPLPVEVFLASIWGREFHHFKGPADRFSRLFNWPDVNDILATRSLSESQIQVLWGEQQVNDSVYLTSSSARGYRWMTVRPERINTLLANGATLRLRQVDQLHRGVGELAAGLERELRDRVRVNVYANCGPAERSTVHRDDHDVIVLQVDGAKHWRIYGSAVPRPLPGDGEHAGRPTADPPGEPVAELHLQPGDVLYLPRGIWHSAEAVEGPSLHLTAGIWRATGVDLLEWLVDGLRASDLLRADVPRGQEADQRHYLSQVRDLLDARLADPDVLRRMFRDRDALESVDIGITLPTSAQPSPAAGLAPSHRIRLLARRAVVEPDGDQVVLRAGGQVLRCADGMTPVLERLVGGELLAVSELTSRCRNGDDAAELRDVLGALVAKGLADVT